jgi:hypothetical protein
LPPVLFRNWPYISTLIFSTAHISTLMCMILPISFSLCHQ